jgi:hypothetical protein
MSLARTAALIAVLLGGVLGAGLASAQGWYDDHWLYRRGVAISNPVGATLTNHQVLVTLTSTFDFSRAKPDGSDLRVTAGDGTTLIPFWIEKWNAGGQQAAIWVKVPSIPVGGTTLSLYYGNSAAGNASSGSTTFEFFDDFDANTAPGYYSLSSGQTVMVPSQAWESEAPHSLSVIQAPVGASYTYYGYYGLVGCEGIGMAGSNDLVQWTKFGTNPLFTGGGERWPSVISVGGTYYMVHTRDYCGTSNIVWRSSVDGLAWSAPTQMVAPVGGQRNQNPNLYQDPNNGQYYLYWFKNDGAYNIMARTASTVAGLATAADNTLLRDPGVVLAAPNVMYRDGTYFLSTETSDGGIWKVRVYSGTAPMGPFTLLPGNPVLSDGCACLFQTPVANTLYDYYCKQTGSTWTLDLRTADLTAPRLPYGAIDGAKWTAFGGTWTAPTTTQPNGSTGVVVQGVTGTRQLLKSSYSGADYILEGYGRQIAGRVWGLGLRVTDANNLYSINLYEDLDGVSNLYLYTWVNGTVPTSKNAAVGRVDLNTWYKLVVKAHGATIDVYVNDAASPNLSFGNSQYAAGAIAVYGETGTTAQFDNLRVRKYAATDPGAAVGAEEAQAPPVITAVAAAPGASGTTATVTWTTDLAATSRVDFGTAPGTLGSVATSPGLVTSHSVALSGLAAGVTYYYRVTSANGAGASSQQPVAPGTLDFTAPWADAVMAVVPGGACISNAHACVAIPVGFARYDATPIRAYSVAFHLSPELAACGVRFAQGPYLGGATTFQVIDYGGGAWSVDESMLGHACGATGSGTLFTMYVGSGEAAGTGTITVDSVRVRDCANNPVPGDAGAAALVPIDNTPPAGVTSLVAHQVLSANDTTRGTTGIAVTFTPPGDGSRVEVYRRGFGNYPEYDDGTTPGSVPPPPAYPPVGWALTGVTASGQADDPGVRDYWYYVAYAIDGCGNASASSMSGGALDYHLGDVHDGVADCAGDNRVKMSDISFLGAHYGVALGEPDALACLDIGPTANGWVDGLPQTDDRIDFEDLILFAINFGQARGPGLASRLAPATPRGTSLRLEVPGLPAIGETFDALLILDGGGDVQGLSAKLDYDPAVVEPVGVTKGALLARQSGPGAVFTPAPGSIDAVVLGRGKGLVGSGELAHVVFRVLAAGDPRISLGTVDARDQVNRPVTLEPIASMNGPAPPERLMLAAGYPNPFEHIATIAFGLPRRGIVSLTVFDLQGRTVRHLMDGAAEAGWTRVRWDGRGDNGRLLASGAFVIRLAADGRAITKSIRLVR